MKAAVSGRAAAAIVLDGEAWFRIDSDDPSVIKPAGPHEWPYVFGVSQDVEYVEAATFEEVRKILDAAVTDNHALTLALICLDLGSEFQTKIEAAEYLERILSRTPNAERFLWRVLTARPLPRDASVEDAFDASVGNAAAFFARLREYQPAIRCVRDAWSSLSGTAFGTLSRDDFEAFTIHEGIWEAYVEAAFQRRVPSPPPPPRVPDDWSRLQINCILTIWSERVAENFDVTHVLRIESTTSTNVEVSAEDRTLFAATDADMEALQQIDFHGSLINNLLLRRRLVIPDIYFFTSNGIADHLSLPNTLLENAIAAGFVVAACRYRNADFETTYKILRRQRIVSRPCDYVIRLQRAAEQNPDRSFLYWPIEGVSKAYDRYLSVLEGDGPPAAALQAAADSGLEENWELTRDWRSTLIYDAREATLRHGGIGVYKRELFRQLVKAVVGHPAVEITGIRSLLAVAKEFADKVRIFWSWAAEGHRFSRAQMLGAPVYSPGYERVQNLFVTSALGSLTSANPLQVEVVLPSTSALKQLSPMQIIELRRGPGEDYFNAIERCYIYPAERENVKKALEQYASEVLNVSGAHLGRIPVKRVELSVGLPSGQSDTTAARREQFLAMTTFDSWPSKLYAQHRPGGRIGGVTINDQTDVCVANDVFLKRD